MRTITIITPANIEVEYRLAGVGSRLAAFLIDFALQILAIGLVALIMLLGVQRYLLPNASGVLLGFVMLAAFVIHFGYFIISELTMNGQSVGKRIFCLRVIRDNGQPIGLAQSLVRGLFRSAVDMIYAGLFVILFSRRHKRIGDMVAGTIVVSEHYSGTGEPQLGLSAAVALPDFLRPHEARMTDEERRIVADWLRRKDTLSDGGAAMAQKLAVYFNRKNVVEQSENQHIYTIN